MSEAEENVWVASLCCLVTVPHIPTSSNLGARGRTWTSADLSSLSRWFWSLGDYLLMYLFIYLRERRRVRVEHEWGEGADGEGKRASPADSALSMEPGVGLELTTPRSRPELKSTQPAEPPRCPGLTIFVEDFW